MERKYRFLLGGVLLAGAISYLIYSAASSTSVYYLTLAEFMPQREALADEGVRVAGRVGANSVNWNAATLDLKFKLANFEDNDGVPVAYNGVLPDMFAEGRDVIVEGTYAHDGSFHARTLLTACPSKYEAEAAAEVAKE